MDAGVIREALEELLDVGDWEVGEEPVDAHPVPGEAGGVLEGRGWALVPVQADDDRAGVGLDPRAEVGELLRDPGREPLGVDVRRAVPDPALLDGGQVAHPLALGAGQERRPGGGGDTAREAVQDRGVGVPVVGPVPLLVGTPRGADHGGDEGGQVDPDRLLAQHHVGAEHPGEEVGALVLDAGELVDVERGDMERGS
jgi:hypothetical protein